MRSLLAGSIHGYADQIPTGPQARVEALEWISGYHDVIRQAKDEGRPLRIDPGHDSEKEVAEVLMKLEQARQCLEGTEATRPPVRFVLFWETRRPDHHGSHSHVLDAALVVRMGAARRACWWFTETATRSVVRVDSTAGEKRSRRLANLRNTGDGSRSCDEATS